MIQDHVTSLDLAKQLVEAGIVVESEFYWVIEYEKSEPILIRKEKGWASATINGALKSYPAPFASEIGELLPYSSAKIDGSYFESRKGMASWRVYWTDLHTGKWIADFEDQSEANARAKMLLYLKEKGLL